jgi:hypothetical protein
VAFDGKQFVRTGVTANAFKYLTAAQSSQNEVASPTGFEPCVAAICQKSSKRSRARSCADV